MNKTIAQLSTDEFEKVVERTVDRRLEVWMTQLMDALTGAEGEPAASLNPDFAKSLKRAMQQARAGEGIDLKSFRQQFEA
ncbi:MAG: hypothetical protein FD146_1415 [Anaerolineaceae bacterium]|nr:MAG: hypothetical protein FD146_1415 [Anaerolineaceae bacterium]